MARTPIDRVFLAAALSSKSKDSLDILLTNAAHGEWQTISANFGDATQDMGHKTQDPDRRPQDTTWARARHGSSCVA